MSDLQADNSVDFSSLASAARQQLFTRPMFFIGGTALCMLPMLLIGVVIMAIDSQRIFGSFQHLGDVSWALQNQASPFVTGLSLLNYPVMAVAYSTSAAIAARGSLDLSAGTPDSLFGTIRRSFRPIAWMVVMDTMLGFVLTMGCACCFIPGIVVFIFIILWLSVQTACLCDQPIDWFEAGKRSKSLTEGHGGTFFVLFIVYIVLVILVVILAYALGGAVFYGLEGGLNPESPTLIRSALITYAVVVVIAWVPNTALHVWWAIARAIFYRRAVPSVDRAQLSNVFQ